MTDLASEIWVVRPEVDALNQLHEGCGVAHLGIEIEQVGPNYIEGSMPVDERTTQPFGLLHGGAAAMLLETLGSAAANHCVDERHICVGLEINCNHIRGVRSGRVVGRAEAVHVGRSSMVWALTATDEAGRLVTSGRLTSQVLEKKTDQ